MSGRRHPAPAHSEIDANGMAVSPGFVNMLSWAVESLLIDGRAQSDIRQGVTLEVFGEGTSMGPLDAQMKEDMVKRQGDLKYPVEWTTLGEYLEHLEREVSRRTWRRSSARRTMRVHVLGERDVDPTAAQLDRHARLVRQGMEEGALGIGSSLIYAPDTYAETAGAHRSHGRGRAMRRHVHHAHAQRGRGCSRRSMKPSRSRAVRAWRRRSIISRPRASPTGTSWRAPSRRSKLRALQGLPLTANMYTYTAGATGLDAAMPPWVQDGGLEAWIERLKDPKIRARVIKEMRASRPTGRTSCAAGTPANVLLVAFKSEKLKPLMGKTLEEVAKERGVSRRRMRRSISSSRTALASAPFISSCPRKMCAARSRCPG